MGEERGYGRPRRGSGALGRPLALTSPISIRFAGVIFQRFLNPERVSMPDFRHRFLRNPAAASVAATSRSAIGADKVAQIITFGNEARARPQGYRPGAANALRPGRPARQGDSQPPDRPGTLKRALDASHRACRRISERRAGAPPVRSGDEARGAAAPPPRLCPGVVIGDRPHLANWCRSTTAPALGHAGSRQFDMKYFEGAAS